MIIAGLQNIIGKKWIVFASILFGPIIFGYLIEKISKIYKHAVLQVSLDSRK
jgi:hypothetical protein